MSILSRRGFIKTSLALSATPLLASTSEKASTLKFIHVTDSHMDLSDGDSVEAMKLMVSFINENYKDLDFVLFGGDNYNNNVAQAKDAKVFKAICDGLHCAYYAVRGNKESSSKTNDINTFNSLFVKDKALHVEGNHWVLEKNGYVILGLDSCIDNANNGIYSQKTMGFAKKILDKNRATVMLNHHPYTNYWKGTESKDIHKYVLNNGEQVQKELFSYNNLLLTLSGHKHIDSVKEVQGTKMIVTRGFVRPMDLDNYPMRYIELNGNTINEKLIYTA